MVLVATVTLREYQRALAHVGRDMRTSSLDVYPAWTLDQDTQERDYKPSNTFQSKSCPNSTGCPRNKNGGQMDTHNCCPLLYVPILLCLASFVYHQTGVGETASTSRTCRAKNEGHQDSGHQEGRLLQNARTPDSLLMDPTPTSCMSFLWA